VVRIEGADQIRKALFVDQSPIRKSPRSNPVTFVKAFDPIRKLYAGTPLARQRRYTPGTFSFNVRGGRCEACEGEGVTKVEMYFLADLFLTCDACGGSRYRKEILDVRLRGKDIREALDMTVDEALDFFADAPEAQERLHVLARVGLGYLRLGQPSNTLSGGEAQRIKIARELGPGRETGVLYILDEPTVGLHFSEVDLLLGILRALVRGGNSVIVIEHNLELVGRADWVVDLGPEGGDGGGRLVAEGEPRRIARHQGSHTGRFLREWYGERDGESGDAGNRNDAGSAFEKLEAAGGGRGRPLSDRLP
jgi:excinuclease ABC subunit A